MGLHTVRSPEQEAKILARAKWLRGTTKLGIRPIAAQLGVGREWLKRRLEPEYAKALNERKLRARSPFPRWGCGTDPTSNAELQRLKAQIPKDTRDVTGRICGDPVFERSALYQKMSGGQA